MYVREQNDLISNRGDPPYAHHPFEDERSFEFVNWCQSNNVTQTAEDQLLKRQHSPLRESVQQSIKSVHCLEMLIKKMEDGLSMNSWTEAEIDVTQNANHHDPIKFWYHDPIETAKWLLRQTYSCQNLVFSPERSFTNSIRQYGAMHTGDCWWNEQDKLTAGASRSIYIPLQLNPPYGLCRR